jgi:hypothetical protein
MCGIGINTNAFNFQIPSASYGYYWRYGGTNETGTLLFQCRTATINTVANTPCIGVGLVGAPAYQLHLNVDSAGKPSTTTWTVTSDERIKENIEFANIDLCYENMKKLPLKRFRWKDEVYEDGVINDRRVLGWIAQDVEQVFPKSVTKREMHGFEDCRDLNVDEINKSHYGATQKLIQKVETLEQENTQLKSLLETVLLKLNTLENELKNIKN